MIDLSELLEDPDFCDTYKVLRKRSYWNEGKQVSDIDEFTVEGIVLPSTSKDIDMLPEGDRQHGLKTFFSPVPLHVTDTEETSDICVYRGQQYKLLSAFDYQSNGFYKAIGTLTGDTDDV